MTGSIESKEHGPYLVKGLSSLKNSKGDPLPTDSPVIALCRCGQSANKPFCDGTHKNVGFSSDVDDPSPGEWKDYSGRHVTIHDNRHLCAHAGECTDGLSRVWRMGEDPWIDPDGADVEAIVEVIKRCPSGALSYSIDGVRQDQEPGAEGITISKDGPYHVNGGVTLKDSARNIDGAAGPFALCRCGESKNKPFCDGSHWHAGFKDDQN